MKRISHLQSLLNTPQGKDVMDARKERWTAQLQKSVDITDVNVSNTKIMTMAITYSLSFYVKYIFSDITNFNRF